MSVSRRCLSISEKSEVAFAEMFETADDDQLVATAKDGSREAFGELVKRHTDKLFHTTLRITRNREDAEDAIQECFVSALVHLESFDGRSRFSTWLTRIAINAALMRLRKHRTLREVPMEPAEQDESSSHFEVTDTKPNPEEWYAEHERRRILRGAIVTLRPKLRETVEVHHLKYGSLEETADTLGISRAAAKARLFHARAALRRTPQIKAVGQSNRLSASGWK
jgi:RNA polymerase sigma factor (sigma-70 family)